MKDWLREFVELIANEKTDVTANADKAIVEIEAEIARLHSQASLIRDLAAHYGPPSGNLPTALTAPDSHAPKSTAAERHKWIRDAALAISKGRDSIHVSEVEAELARSGKIFPYGNLGARIGTVLNFHPDEFRRAFGGNWLVLWWKNDPQEAGLH